MQKILNYNLKDSKQNEKDNMQEMLNYNGIVGYGIRKLLYLWVVLVTMVFKMIMQGNVEL